MDVIHVKQLWKCDPRQKILTAAHAPGNGAANASACPWMSVSAWMSTVPSCVDHVSFSSRCEQHETRKWIQSMNTLFYGHIAHSNELVYKQAR